MPVSEIRVSEPQAYEAVDVIASSVLKEPHRKFGGWMKELANLVHTYYTPEIKGHWQGLWTLATKCFSRGYKGWSMEAALDEARVIAREFNIEGVDFEKLCTESYELGTRYGEKRAKRKKAPA